MSKYDQPWPLDYHAWADELATGRKSHARAWVLAGLGLLALAIVAWVLLR